MYRIKDDFCVYSFHSINVSRIYTIELLFNPLFKYNNELENCSRSFVVGWCIKTSNLFLCDLRAIDRVKFWKNRFFNFVIFWKIYVSRIHMPSFKKIFEKLTEIQQFSYDEARHESTRIILRSNSIFSERDVLRQLSNHFIRLTSRSVNYMISVISNTL